MYESLLQANDAGDYFPIWGTCLGFQFMMVHLSIQDIRTKSDSDDYNIPLDMTNGET